MIVSIFFFMVLHTSCGAVRFVFSTLSARLLKIYSCPPALSIGFTKSLQNRRKPMLFCPTETKKHRQPSPLNFRNSANWLPMLYFSVLALSVIAARCQIPPFVAARHLPPAGGSRPSKWEPLAVHANFISLPRSLPLGEVDANKVSRRRGRAC